MMRDRPTKGKSSFHWRPFFFLLSSHFHQLSVHCLHVCVCITRRNLRIVYIATTLKYDYNIYKCWRWGIRPSASGGIIKSYPPPPPPPKIWLCVCGLLALLLSFWVIMICCHIVRKGGERERLKKYEIIMLSTAEEGQSNIDGRAPIYYYTAGRILVSSV